MTNFQIITAEAISHGLYTETEAEEIIKARGQLPLHTFKEWKRMGFIVRKGEHAKLTCSIWRWNNKHNSMPQDENEVEIDESHFYKIRAHFFDETQIERMVTA